MMSQASWTEVEVGAYLVAGPKTFELVQPDEGPLDGPSGLVQAGALRGATTGGLRCDSTSSGEAAALVEVVAAVGDRPPEPATGAGFAGRGCAEQCRRWHELSDVVAVPADQSDSERGAVSVDDQVVLAAGTAPVD